MSALATPADPLGDAGLPAAVITNRRAALRRVPGKAKVGAVILGLFILVAIMGPWIAPFDPSATTPGQALPLGAYRHSSARHHRHRPGRPLAAARRDALDRRARAAHRRDRDHTLGADRHVGRLPRRVFRRGPVARGQRVPGPAGAAAAGGDPRLPAAHGRAAHGDRAERAGLAVGGAGDPRADAVAARARLRGRGTRGGREQLADHLLRDPPQRDRPDRRELRGNGPLRDPHLGRAGVPRRVGSVELELRDDALLGAGRQRRPARGVVVVRASWGLHRAAGHEPGPAQLRARRARQPTPARRQRQARSGGGRGGRPIRRRSYARPRRSAHERGRGTTRGRRGGADRYRRLGLGLGRRRPSDPAADPRHLGPVDRLSLRRRRRPRGPACRPGPARRRGGRAGGGIGLRQVDARVRLDAAAATARRDHRRKRDLPRPARRPPAGWTCSRPTPSSCARCAGARSRSCSRAR